jgi:hypothetical protein
MDYGSAGEKSHWSEELLNKILFEGFLKMVGYLFLSLFFLSIYFSSRNLGINISSS